LNDADDVAAIARALAHPARLAIIERFADGHPKLTKDLVAPSGLAPSTMSEHLRILREAGILVARHDGPSIWYCLRSGRLEAFSEAIQRLTERPGDRHQQRHPSAVMNKGPWTLPMFVE
jgi:ArsR family transcriptional regulator